MEYNKHYNLDAYNKIFIIETWMRPIIFVSLMIKHGSKWPEIFSKCERKKAVKNIVKSKNNPLLISYEASNLMWFTTINELKNILKEQDITDIILKITGRTETGISSLKIIFSMTTYELVN